MKKNYFTALKIFFIICNFLLILVFSSFNYNHNDYLNTKDLIAPSSPEDSWWHPHYKYRVPINIFNEYKSPLPKGYSVKISVNTAILISEGKLKNDGRDLRIVWYNLSNEAWWELDRFIGTNLNTDDTQIWFKTQTSINSNSHDTNYYLYYGNEDADEPPTDKNKIFDFYDDFDQPDGDANGWTVISGNWSVINNEYCENAALPDCRSLLNSYTVENASIEVRIKNVGISFGVGISFRYSDADNFYCAGIGYWDREIAYGECTGGSWDTLDYDGVDESNLVSDQWYNLKVDALGSRYKIYLDGELRIDDTDTSHLNAAQIGFLTHTSAPSYYDDLRIRLLVPVEPILTLGDEEKYEFSIKLIFYGESIPSNEKIIIQFMITASNGVKNATLYFGYDYPYEQFFVVGNSIGENIWEYLIPPQGDSYEGSILKFFLLAYANGDPPESEIDDNSGSYYSIHIIDEDTIGPEIGSPECPSSIHSNESIGIVCNIVDPSGVQNTILYFGYNPPYNQYFVDGNNVGENIWEFIIEPQGEENEGKVLYFFISASDDDNSPATTIADNEGTYYSVNIIDEGGDSPDDDRKPPIIIITGYLSELIITFLFLGVIFIFYHYIHKKI
ncbi:MAG: DUF2341 domain-containing protein [Candidatus Hodarchaeota archaeon]